MNHFQWESFLHLRCSWTLYVGPAIVAIFYLTMIGDYILKLRKHGKKRRTK